MSQLLFTNSLPITFIQKNTVHLYSSTELLLIEVTPGQLQKQTFRSGPIGQSTAQLFDRLGLYQKSLAQIEMCELLGNTYVYHYWVSKFLLQIMRNFLNKYVT